MRKIEFVSYSGKYPCLCCGELLVRVDGEERKVDCSMISGGSIWINGADDGTTEGPWSIRFLDDFFTAKEQARIVELVNENVEHGCCGGCI